MFKRPVAEGKKLFRWREVLVLIERSLLPEGRGFEQFVSRLGGVGHYLPCPPQGPGGVQVVEGWQIAAYHPLCRAEDTLQPWSLAVAAAYQMVMEEVRMDSMMEV